MKYFIEFYFILLNFVNLPTIFCKSLSEKTYFQKQPLEMFIEISQNSQENTYVRVSFLIKLQARPATLLKKTLTQVFSCKFCEFSENNFFTEHLCTTASNIFISNSTNATCNLRFLQILVFKNTQLVLQLIFRATELRQRPKTHFSVTHKFSKKSRTVCSRAAFMRRFILFLLRADHFWSFSPLGKK